MRATLASLVVLVFLFAFVPTQRALAATVTAYVDSQIGASSCGTYNAATRTCSGGSATAYNSLSGGSTAAQPGTTLLLRAGIYNQQLKPVRSGTAGNPITYRAYPGERSQIEGTPAVDISNLSYIVLDGIYVKGNTWLEAQNTHRSVVQNSIFLDNPSSGTTGNIRFIKATFNKFLNNYVSGGTDNVLFIDATNNLMEGNVVKEARHSIFGIRCGDFNIIRNNFFANTQQKQGEAYDCFGTSAVPNSVNSTTHNVIEKNIFADNRANYYSTSNDNGIQYSAQDGIIRQNVFFNTLVGIGVGTYAGEAEFADRNRIYQNTFYKNRGAGVSGLGGTNNLYKNNILSANEGCLPDCNAVSPGQIVYRSLSDPTGVLDSNLLFFQSPGQNVMEVEFGSGQTIAQFAAANPGRLVNSLEANPQFVNLVKGNSTFTNPITSLREQTYDLRLQSTSPAIDRGAFLTTTTTAGSGATLPVVDARYFQYGFGIDGELGDLIQLQGQTQTARVTGVNYNTNTLTLSTSLTRTAGQGVALAYNGTSPDMGAFEFGGISPTPTPTVTPTPTPGTDTIAPRVLSFDVQPRTAGAGATVTAPFSVSDIGGSHLARVDLHRAPFNAANCNATVKSGCQWSTPRTQNAPATADTWSGSLTDAPPAGVWWYGIAVRDNVARVGYEPLPISVTAGGPTPSATVTKSEGQNADPSNLSRHALHEGDVVAASDSGDPDVFIVNEWGYKRLFLNPAIFNFYGHLGFHSVHPLVPTVRDAFPTSGLFRNCEAGDPNVYAVEVTSEDSGTLHHVQLSGDAATSQDPSFFHRVFCINTNEFNWYPKSPVPYTSLNQVPSYHRK